jgi:hypothetical protein
MPTISMGKEENFSFLKENRGVTGSGFFLAYLLQFIENIHSITKKDIA